MDKQNLIVASPECQMYTNIGGVSLQLATATEFSYAFATAVNEIFAIGQKPPIGLIDINKTYTGELSIQSGEAQTILDAINATVRGSNFYATFLELPPFTLSWSYKFKTDVGTSRTVTVSMMNCIVSNEGGSISRNSPETITSFSIRGIGAQRNVIAL